MKRLIGVPAIAMVLITGCGAAAHNNQPSTTPAATHTATVNPNQAAIDSALTGQCKPAQALDDSINAATTFGDFQSGVGGWEAQLTALNGLAPSSLPDGTGANYVRKIAVDYAEANFALAVAAEHDDPFSGSFSRAKVRRGYNAALAALQDVLNICVRTGH